MREADISRRRVLKAGLGATALFLPLPYASVWAQSEGAMKLLRLPKIALVLGNSKYAHVPTLINPGNDARAIGDLLRERGFDVTAKLDATLDDMSAAVRTYVQTLAARKAVGLFYFAGHGVQLAWRNYLVPVDAATRTLEEIPKTCIDLNAVMEGINKASNPMNIVILDACRDNPFAMESRAAGRTLTTMDASSSTPSASEKGGIARGPRGLSQMDAPHSTLLAYATAPGHVASDGEGANGLYTENLLREMRVPEARIEEIFKRVRLHVRRRTKGEQIPWESTSLEEDFYFVPPKALSTRADEEAERERKEEMAGREKRRAEEEAERKRKQEQALREAKLAAEEAERKRQQELALLEQQRVAEEAERKRKQELALEEARRVGEEAERKRREAQALQEAKTAEEAAVRKHQQELALREKRRTEDDAARKRGEEQLLRDAKLAEEAAARKFQQEVALREKQLAQEDAERRRKQQPGSIRKPDPDLLERQFQEELALWEKIKASNEAAPLEDYLLRYPSGNFSELAQFRLDQVLARQGEKKIQVVSAAENPYSKGTAVADTNRKVGDSYTYREMDLYTKVVQRTFTRTIEQITDSEVLFRGGGSTDLLGNSLRTSYGAPSTGSQIWGVDYAVGKRWTSRHKTISRTGVPTEVELAVRVVAREKITVPAGTFNTFVVEAEGYGRGGKVNTRTEHKYWLVPDQVRAEIAFEIHQRTQKGNIVASSRRELVSFQQG